MWYLFEYTSGCNPYVTYKEHVCNNVLNKYKRQGITVSLISFSEDGVHYKVHDAVQYTSEDEPF